MSGSAWRINLLALLFLTTPLVAQQQRFCADQAGLEGILFFLEIPQWNKSLANSPSTELKRLTRLTCSGFCKEGALWSARSPQGEFVLDPSRWSLTENDARAVQEILKNPIVARLVECVRPALANRANKRCFVDLANEAGQQRDAEVREAFQSYIGALLIRLGRSNPEWRELKFNRDESRVQDALDAHFELERKKACSIMMIEGYGLLLDGCRIGFRRHPVEIGPEEKSGDWLITNTLGWRVTAQKDMAPVLDPKKSRLHEFFAENGRTAYVAGSLDVDLQKRLAATGDLEEFLEIAGTRSLGAFLSRMGSQRIAVID